MKSNKMIGMIQPKLQMTLKQYLSYTKLVASEKLLVLEKLMMIDILLK